MQAVPIVLLHTDAPEMARTIVAAAHPGRGETPCDIVDPTRGY